MKVDIIAILLGILFILFGSAIGWIIAKKTKLLDNLTEKQRYKNKILNDPELLIEKIKESVKKMNPEGKGDVRIIDDKEEIILGTKEVNGKKVLDIKKIPYTPAEKDYSPMMLASKVNEAAARKKEELKAKDLEAQAKTRELEQMNTRQEIEEKNKELEKQNNNKDRHSPNTVRN